MAITVNNTFSVTKKIDPAIVAFARYDRSWGMHLLTMTGNKKDILAWLKEFVAELEEY